METQDIVQEQPEKELGFGFRYGTIRKQLREIPEDSFIVGAVASIAASLVLRSIRKHSDAHFVGQWAPTLLLLGLYAKRRREMRSEEQPCAQGLKGEREVH